MYAAQTVFDTLRGAPLHVPSRNPDYEAAWGSSWAVACGIQVSVGSVH
ncbi:hypothetical protein J7I98_24815 [Streptomyces sp. ISL-98]|nr:hypothetical protein [Streptomyces sp. ISL-98]MBT2509053.1 hypothetical protein [Streptomyces sp. ISL-98]